ncbi:hypothetical protein PJM29_31305, partial [Mycobacterium kansasii]
MKEADSNFATRRNISRAKNSDAANYHQIRPTRCLPAEQNRLASRYEEIKFNSFKVRTTYDTDTSGRRGYRGSRD